MKQFKNILFVAEGAAEQASALARAVSLAAKNQANLTVAGVIPPTSTGGQAEAAAIRRRALASMTTPYQDSRLIDLRVLVGEVYREVIGAVIDHGYDLVIKVAENPDFLQRLFGSNDVHLMRKCPSPVWLMKPQEKPNYRCIMAAFDLNPHQSTVLEQDLNQGIVELAGSLAISDHASLHLVHAWGAFAEGALKARLASTDEEIAAHVENERRLYEAGLFRLGERLRERIGPEAYRQLLPQFHLPKGPARKRIVSKAVELHADLIVIGTVARTGVSGFLIGNTAEAILEELQCSVLVVKPSGLAV